MEKQIPKLQLFNTLTGEKEEFTPLEAGKVRMYVCGPTVYDDAHLGHARCYITWDVLYRFLKFLGYDVTYARNVTDVDDKILKRAAELNASPHEIAKKNYESFSADMKALNVLTPDEEPFATAHIPHMIKAIEDLIAKDAAYVTPDGVYYRVASKADYGKLSKKPLDDLRAGARVEVDPNKESPLDFALWKLVSKEEEKKEHHAYDSPWGPGRPGWHIECSAMNHAIFGAQIDIHAGGADLIFPHHENEIAQSESWHGQQFSKYWLHNGFVNVSGDKMSKSLGNFATIKTILEKYDANTIRYFLLTNGYRMPVDFNEEALEGAKNRVERIHKTLKYWAEVLKLSEANITNNLATTWEETDQQFSHHTRDCAVSLCEDLNLAKALTAFNNAISVLGLQDSKAIETRIEFKKKILTHEEQRLAFYYDACSTFHLLGFSVKSLFQNATLPLKELQTIYKELTGEWLNGDKTPEECLSHILAMRKKAKETKNFQQADAIRKHLTDIGLEVMDYKDGMAAAKDGIEIVRV